MRLSAVFFFVLFFVSSELSKQTNLNVAQIAIKIQSFKIKNYRCACTVADIYN